MCPGVPHGQPALPTRTSRHPAPLGGADRLACPAARARCGRGRFLRHDDVLLHHPRHPRPGRARSARGEDPGGGRRHRPDRLRRPGGPHPRRTAVPAGDRHRGRADQTAARGHQRHRPGHRPHRVAREDRRLRAGLLQGPDHRDPRDHPGRTRRDRAGQPGRRPADRTRRWCGRPVAGHRVDRRHRRGGGDGGPGDHLRIGGRGRTADADRASASAPAWRASCGPPVRSRCPTPHPFSR